MVSEVHCKLCNYFFLFKNGSSFTFQIGGIIIGGVYTVLFSSIIIFVLKLFIPMRVSEETEWEGLDLREHGEKAYDLST